MLIFMIQMYYQRKSSRFSSFAALAGSLRRIGSNCCVHHYHKMHAKLDWKNLSLSSRGCSKAPNHTTDYSQARRREWYIRMRWVFSSDRQLDACGVISVSCPVPVHTFNVRPPLADLSCPTVTVTVHVVRRNLYTMFEWRFLASGCVGEKKSWSFRKKCWLARSGTTFSQINR